MKRQTKKTVTNVVISILAIAFIIGIFAIVGYSNKTLSVSDTGTSVQYLIPHLASIKCEVVDKASLTYDVPESGIWINKDEIGFKAKLVNDIYYSVPYTFWESLGRDIRVKTQICDSNKQNCQNVQYTSNFLQLPGTIKINLNSIDVTQNSLYVALEYKSIGTLFQWKPTSGGSLTYSADKFGLTIYSTTTGFGGIICPTSCDLSCPAQSVRSKLVYDPKNSLNFYETTNYLEFWDQPALIGEQYGGTVWDSSKEQFCFGGYIYSAGTLDMKDGRRYIYPKTYLKKIDCCPGATVSLTNGGSKICTNGAWQTINPQTPPECTSDFNCPNQGKTVCSSDSGKFYTSGWHCQTNKCVQSSSTQVSCCPTNLGCALDQVCSPEQGYTCVGGSVYNPPSNLSGNESATIQSCSSCDAFAKSYIFSSIFPKTECKPTFLQGTVTCALSFIKLAFVVIVFIFSLLFSKDFFSTFKSFKRREGLAWLPAILLSITLAYLSFVIFWMGIVAFVLVIIVRIIRGRK